MALSFKINNTERNVRLGSLNVTKVINGRNSLRADVLDYEPTYGQTVVLRNDDNEVEFTGQIETVRASAINGTPIPAVKYSITCSDQMERATRETLTVAFGSETMFARLVYIFTYYMSGVTLDASNPTGPTLEARTYDHAVIADVFDDIAKMSGDYVWEIDENLVFRMYDTTDADGAPFDVIDGDGNHEGDITVERSRQNYKNRIVIKAGEAKTLEKTDGFTGNGSATAYTLTYPIVISPWPGYVTVNGTTETLGLSGDGAVWTLDPAAGTITRTSAVTTGHAISITYTAQFPIYRQADDAGEQSANGLREKVIPFTNIYDADEAQTEADNQLALHLVESTKISYTTRTAGLRPGQMQHITADDRDLDDDALITEVTVRNEANSQSLVYSVTAIAAGQISTWQDYYKTGGSGSRSSSGGGVGAIAGRASVSRWDGDAPQIGDVGIGVSGFASSPGAITFDRLSATNAWGLAVGSDGAGDFFGLANKVSGQWAFKVYETGGNTLAFCPPTGTSLAHWLGSSAGSSLRWAQLHIARGKIYEGGFSSGIGEWPTYTPSLVSVGGSPSIGTGGTLTGREMRVGNTGFFAFELTLGTSFSFGTGNVGITLPQTASANNRGAMDASATDTGVNGYPLIAKRASIGGAQVCGLFQWASPLAAITTTVPFTFASGDVISGAGWFEV